LVKTTSTFSTDLGEVLVESVVVGCITLFPPGLDCFIEGSLNNIASAAADITENTLINIRMLQ